MFRYIYEKRTCSRLFSPTRSRIPRPTIICQQFKTEELGTSIIQFLLFDWFGVNVLKTRQKETTNPSFYNAVFEPPISDVFFQAGLPSILVRKKGNHIKKPSQSPTSSFLGAKPRSTKKHGIEMSSMSRRLMKSS